MVISKNGNKIKLLHHKTFKYHEKEAFQNFVGNGENVGHQYFLLFPQCFQSYHREVRLLEEQ